MCQSYVLQCPVSRNQGNANFISTLFDTSADDISKLHVGAPRGHKCIGSHIYGTSEIGGK